MIEHMSGMMENVDGSVGLGPYNGVEGTSFIK
jgi:hypothetical protein